MNRGRQTLQRQNASLHLTRSSSDSSPKLNIMTPPAGPRPNDSPDTGLPAIVNRPRGNALDTLDAKTIQRMETTIEQGPGNMHKKSEKKLHKERAFIYDQSKRGKVMQAFYRRFKRGLDKQTKIAATEEARGLKSYQTRVKEHNPKASLREKIGGTLKKTQKGAKLVDSAGTVTTFVAPQAAVGVKAAAKATSFAAGFGSAFAYHKSSKAYAKNVDEHATGIEMFDSHISREKSLLTKNQRNKMALKTGISALSFGAGAGFEAAMENASERVADIAQKGYDAVEKKVKKKGKKASKRFKTKIKMNKSELVNLMRNQRAFN